MQKTSKEKVLLKAAFLKAKKNLHQFGKNKYHVNEPTVVEVGETKMSIKVKKFKPKEVLKERFPGSNKQEKVPAYIIFTNKINLPT